MIARTPYLWWIAADTEHYRCPFCEDSVAVPLSIQESPYETDGHPWWRIPQNRSQAFYGRLWQNWDYTTGRVVL